MTAGLAAPSPSPLEALLAGLARSACTSWRSPLLLLVVTAIGLLQTVGLGKGGKGSSLSFGSVSLTTPPGAPWARPRPCAARLDPGPLSAIPDAHYARALGGFSCWLPTLGTLGVREGGQARQKHSAVCVSVSCRAASLGQESRMSIPSGHSRHPPGLYRSLALSSLARRPSAA